MPDQEFGILIKTYLEGQGIKLTEEQFGSLSKKLEESAKAGEKAGISHREAHQALHLLADTAGQALGPIGEFAAFLGNPYIMGAAGATLAVKMLVEQNEKLRIEMTRLITLSWDFRDALTQNIAQAFARVHEQTAAFQQSMSRAGEDQNPFETHLQRTTQLLDQQASAASSLAEARERLFNSNIQGAELSGQMTGPQAHAAEVHAHQAERAEQEAAERRQHAEEVSEQRRQAQEAISHAGILEGQATSQNRADHRVTNEAAAEAQEDRKRDAEDALKKSKDEMAAAQAAAEMSGPRPTLEEAQANPSLTYALNAWEKFDEAAKKHADAVGDVTTATKHLSELKIQAANYEEETKRLQDEAQRLKEWGEQTLRAAEAQERLNHAREAAHGPIDRAEDETEQQNRRNYLMRRIQSGQATPDEQQEAAGAFAANTRQIIAQAASRITQIEESARMHGGHVSPQEFAELAELLDRVIGVSENINSASVSQQRTINNLSTRIRELESSIQGIQRHFENGGNTR